MRWTTRSVRWNSCPDRRVDKPSPPLVVSNTSPLRYFIVAGCSHLIERLFGAVLIPRAVERELTHVSAPAILRQWMQERPSWLQVCDLDEPIDSFLASELDPGEAEAIQLALNRSAAILIMDERRGRLIAERKDLVVVGALGMLVEAYRRKWLDDPLAILDELRSAGFRVSRRLVVRFNELIDAVARE